MRSTVFLTRGGFGNGDLLRYVSHPPPHSLFHNPFPFPCSSLLHHAASGMNRAPSTILNAMERPFGLRSLRRNILALRMVHFPGSRAR